MSEITTNTMANWYGSDRLVARRLALELDDCDWVGIPCLGGGGIVQYLKARTILCGDLHLHLINLAKVIGHPTMSAEFHQQAKTRIVHPVELEQAQQRCYERELTVSGGLFTAPNAVHLLMDSMPNLGWALDYWVTTWMGHGGRSGCMNEFSGSLSIRWGCGRR